MEDNMILLENKLGNVTKNLIKDIVVPNTIDEDQYVLVNRFGFMSVGYLTSNVGIFSSKEDSKHYYYRTPISEPNHIIIEKECFPESEDILSEIGSLNSHIDTYIFMVTIDSRTQLLYELPQYYKMSIEKVCDVNTLSIVCKGFTVAIKLELKEDVDSEEVNKSLIELSDYIILNTLNIEELEDIINTGKFRDDEHLEKINIQIEKLRKS